MMVSPAHRLKKTAKLIMLAPETSFKERYLQLEIIQMLVTRSKRLDGPFGVTLEGKSCANE